ncbi:hypothetical protein ACFXJ8_20215 [Nonomuraea sp. NPDC059194]|uniref:hypothetical protein n=1 Tax=Nonomuraea sp. NPDC059194 TaxID=3346764 RepID=UPI0036CCB62B
MPPWYAREPSPEWPGPQIDVEVDRARLKAIGAAMQAEPDAEAQQYLELGGEGGLGGLPARFGWLLLDDFTEWSWWASLQAVRTALITIDGALKRGAMDIRHSYSDLGGLLFATGVNYDRAVELLDVNSALLDRSVNGMGLRHTIVETKQPWQDEDVSGYDVSYVKQCLESVDPMRLAAQGTLCADLAAWFTEFQGTVEGQARELASAWTGQTSEHALEGMRKVHAAGGALAHASGQTGETITWLAGMLQQYQLDFESAVGLGDWEFDDVLLPSGGVHDRARDFLRELNGRLATAHSMLPSEIETLLPGIVGGSGALGRHGEDGLGDDSAYWGFLELDFEQQRAEAAHDGERAATGGFGYFMPPVGMPMGAPTAGGAAASSPGGRRASPPSRPAGPFTIEATYGHQPGRDRDRPLPPREPREPREHGEGYRRGHHDDLIARVPGSRGGPEDNREPEGERKPGRSDAGEAGPDLTPGQPDAAETPTEQVADAGNAQQAPPATGPTEPQDAYAGNAQEIPPATGPTEPQGTDAGNAQEIPPATGSGEPQGTDAGNAQEIPPATGPTEPQGTDAGNAQEIPPAAGSGEPQGAGRVPGQGVAGDQDAGAAPGAQDAGVAPGGEDAGAAHRS